MSNSAKRTPKAPAVWDLPSFLTHISSSHRCSFQHNVAASPTLSHAAPAPTSVDDGGFRWVLDDVRPSGVPLHVHTLHISYRPEIPNHPCLRPHQHRATVEHLHLIIRSGTHDSDGYFFLDMAELKSVVFYR